MLCFYYQITKPTNQTNQNQFAMYKEAMLALHTCNPRNWNSGDEEFEAILSYKGNVRPAWASGDLVSKEVLEKKTLKQSHPKSHLYKQFC